MSQSHKKNFNIGDCFFIKANFKDTNDPDLTHRGHPKILLKMDCNISDYLIIAFSLL